MDDSYDYSSPFDSSKGLNDEYQALDPDEAKKKMLDDMVLANEPIKVSRTNALMSGLLNIIPLLAGGAFAGKMGAQIGAEQGVAGGTNYLANAKAEQVDERKQAEDRGKLDQIDYTEKLKRREKLADEISSRNFQGKQTAAGRQFQQDLQNQSMSHQDALHAQDKADALQAKKDFEEWKQSQPGATQKQDKETYIIEKDIKNDWKDQSKPLNDLIPIKKTAETVAKLNNPAANIALQERLQQSLVPGKAVRAEFFRKIQEAQNPLNKVAGKVQFWADNGGYLDNNTLKQIAATINAVTDGQISFYKNLADTRFRPLAKQHGVDFNNIIPQDQYNAWFGGGNTSTDNNKKLIGGKTYIRVNGGWAPEEEAQ